MTDLRVKIPIRFKKDLDYRFNPKNAEKTENYFAIEKSCPLCEAFIGCDGCPLSRFGNPYGGCFVWLNEVIGEDRLFTIIGGGVSWRIKDNKLTRKQLLMFRKKAQELIIWKEMK
jgi:hypothetical protein